MAKTLMNYLMGEKCRILVDDGLFYVATNFSFHDPFAYGFKSADKFAQNFGMPITASMNYDIQANLGSLKGVEFTQNYLRVDDNVAMARYVSASGKTMWLNPLLLPPGPAFIYSEDSSAWEPKSLDLSARVLSDPDYALVAILARLNPVECVEWMSR